MSESRAVLRSIKNQISESSAESTSHGFSRIVKANGPIATFFWLLMSVLAASCCSYMIFEFISEYLTYPVTTKIRYVHQKKTQFPAVAVCNSNPFVTPFAVEYLFDVISKMATFNQSGDMTKLEFINEHLGSIKESQAYELNEKSSSFQQLLGFPLNEMIINCEFQRQKCRPEDFKWFFHWDHGNCFSFNFNDTYELISPGPDNSLSLELFANFESILPAYSSSIGFWVMIYNQSYDEKFNFLFEKYPVKTNMETDMVIKLNYIDKLPEPYSECNLDLKTATIHTIDSDLYRHSFLANSTYKQLYCYQKAYRYHTYHKCGCIVELDDYPNVTKICSTPEETKCVDEAFYIDFLKNQFNGRYDNQCPLECNSLEYGLVTFSRTFPTNYYAGKLLKTSLLNVSYPGTIREVQRSVAKVNFYYSGIGYQLIEEIATLTFTDVVAGGGGLLGLFLGMSILSFVEIAEMFAEVFRILMCSGTKISPIGINGLEDK